MQQKMTPGQLSVLRVLKRQPWRVFDGREVIEEIFAMTTETPLDAREICEIVDTLESRGWVKVTRHDSTDDEFDFAGVQMTTVGLNETG